MNKPGSEKLKKPHDRHPCWPGGAALRAAMLAVATGALLLSSVATAGSVQHTRTLTDVNWTSAGIGGVGGAGEGVFEISGIDGAVTHAFLYWHGIEWEVPDGDYVNPDAVFDGTAVTGEEIGVGPTNCWGDGTSRAYRADVTDLINGDGDYAVEGLASEPDYNVNGASLIVVFDGGDPDSASDLVFFEGNDSNVLQNPENWPGQEEGWNAILEPIEYGGGPVFAEFHVADGQEFTSGEVTFSTAAASLTIEPDGLWQGDSVPDMGNSRAPNGSLWDIHLLDITDAFGGETGSVELVLDGQEGVDDCKSLVSLVLALEPGSAPPPGEPPEPPEPPEAESIPTLSAWSTILMALVVMGIGGLVTRRFMA